MAAPGAAAERSGAALSDAYTLIGPTEGTPVPSFLLETPTQWSSAIPSRTQRAMLLVLLAAVCVGAWGMNDTCGDCIARNGTYCLGYRSCSPTANCTRPQCGLSAGEASFCPATADCYARQNCTTCLSGGCHWCQVEQRCVTQSLDALSYCDPANSTGCDNYCTLSKGEECPYPSPCHERRNCVECVGLGHRRFCLWALEEQRCLPAAPGLDFACGEGSEDACLASYELHCPAQPCDGADNCLECTKRRCTWCGGSKTCVPQGPLAPCTRNHTCKAPIVRDTGTNLCPDVDCQHTNCRDCLRANCRWCGGDASCRPKYGAPCEDGQCPVFEHANCPPAAGCAEQASCAECSGSDACGWCPKSQQCVPAYFREASSFCTPNGTAGCSDGGLVTLTQGMCPLQESPENGAPWGIVSVALFAVVAAGAVALWQWRKHRAPPRALAAQAQPQYRTL